MNKLSYQGKWGQTHRYRAGWQLRVEGKGGDRKIKPKKKKGLMDTDNSVVIEGRGSIRELNGNRKIH